MKHTLLDFRRVSFAKDDPLPPTSSSFPHMSLLNGITKKLGRSLAEQGSMIDRFLCAVSLNKIGPTFSNTSQDWIIPFPVLLNNSKSKPQKLYIEFQGSPPLKSRKFVLFNLILISYILAFTVKMNNRLELNVH